MAGSPVSGAVISTLSLGLDIKASELLKTNSLIIRLIVEVNTTKQFRSHLTVITMTLLMVARARMEW